MANQAAEEIKNSLGSGWLVVLLCCCKENMMTKFDSDHTDNELIAKAGELPTPGQGSRSGGKLAQKVGTRAELNAALGGEPANERLTGSDDPAADAAKGPKTQAHIPTRK